MSKTWKEQVAEYESVREAARIMGLPESTLRSRIKAEEIKRSAVIPSGYMVKGTSSYYDSQGSIRGQWVKTQVDPDKMHQIMKELYIGFAETLPKEKKVKAPKHSQEDLLNCYVLTDYHLGMMAWEEESGTNWNLKKAEELLIKWFSSAIKKSPNSGTAVLAQIGDASHIHGMVASTNSGNVLDCDSRYQKIVRSTISLLRQIVKMLLKKHDKVIILNAEGNHDDTNSIWLREMFHAFYENEPRIEVMLSPDPYYAIKHGKTSLFFHHGHKVNMNQIDRVFAGKFPAIYGNTLHRYGHMGHLHHIAAKETALMVIEQHRTLAPKDAYASRGGYLSGRSASVITYDKNYGEVSRITLTPEAVL